MAKHTLNQSEAATSGLFSWGAAMRMTCPECGNTFTFRTPERYPICPGCLIDLESDPSDEDEQADIERLLEEVWNGEGSTRRWTRP